MTDQLGNGEAAVMFPGQGCAAQGRAPAFAVLAAQRTVDIPQKKLLLVGVPTPMEEEIAVMYPGAGLCRPGLNTSVQQQQLLVIMIQRAELRLPEVFPACILQMELLRGGVLTPIEGDAAGSSWGLPGFRFL